MGYIYKVTNMLNGKVYIGQTRRTIRIRWREHIHDAFDREKPCKFALHCAIRKYGKDAFTVEMIEECDNNVLDEREKYWIEQCNSRKHGYNMERGGSGNKGHPIYQYALDGTFIRGFNTTREACIAIGTQYISFNANDATLTSGGYLWRRFKTDKIAPVHIRQYEKRVYQYTSDGDYIGEFDSLVHAAQAVRGRNTGALIGAVCRGDRQHAYGYRWSFTKEAHLHEAVPPKNYKKVIRISPDSGEQKVYPTIANAAKDTGVSPPNITEACKGRLRTSGGYFWKYYDQTAI